MIQTAPPQFLVSKISTPERRKPRRVKKIVNIEPSIGHNAHIRSHNRCGSPYQEKSSPVKLHKSPRAPSTPSSPAWKYSHGLHKTTRERYVDDDQFWKRAKPLPLKFILNHNRRH